MMEHSNMNPIFRYCISNSLIRLTIINGIVLCLALYINSTINVEPMLPELEEAGYFVWTPLDDEIYCSMVLTLLFNIVVIVRQVYKKKNIVHSVCDCLVRNIYLILVCLELSLGYIYIQCSSTYGFIRECNILFYLPILIFGEDTVKSVLSAESVYVTLCVIFLLTTLVDAYTSFRGLTDKSLPAVSTKEEVKNKSDEK